MRRQMPKRVGWACVLLLAGVRLAVADDTPSPGEPVPFAALPGFSTDDHRAAFRVFRASCPATVAPSGPAAVPRGHAPPAALKAACRAALALPQAIRERQAVAFFERHFEPRRLPPGFLTGYYEPVVDGSLAATKLFPTPLLTAPPGLVSARPGEPFPGLDPALSAARRLPDGSLAAMPDRAAIEAGALGAAAPPLVFVHDPVTAFFIQIQGSARVRLRDGSLRRIAFAGRNGQPYTAIGRVLSQELHIPPAEMGMTQLRAWIEAHGQAPGEAGRALMQRNRSYIFVRFDASRPTGAGPVGGAGVTLTPLRSLAVDRKIWPYGLPFFIDADLPWRSDAATPFRRLMVAQDTGAAIVGAARGDIFFGTGERAAHYAGPLRQPGTFYVLWPRSGRMP